MAIINNLPMGSEGAITFPDDGRNYVPAVIASSGYAEPTLGINNSILYVYMSNAAPSSSRTIYIYMLKTITGSSFSLIKGHTYSIQLAKSSTTKTITIKDVGTSPATTVYTKTNISATTTTQSIMSINTISD